MPGAISLPTMNVPLPNVDACEIAAAATAGTAVAIALVGCGIAVGATVGIALVGCGSAVGADVGTVVGGRFVGDGTGEAVVVAVDAVVGDESGVDVGV